MQRKYKCDSCEKLFTKAGILNRHIKAVHEGCKDIKCHLCGNSFTVSGSLKKHIETLHEGQKHGICEFVEDLSLQKTI